MANTMKSQRGRGGGGIGPEETLVASTLKAQNGRGWAHDAEATYVAAPLTKGSATGDGVNAPGRRQEDDVNVVVVPPLVSRSSRGNAQGNSPGHNAEAVVAFHVTQDPISGAQAPAMGKGNQQGCATIGVSDGIGVRRLTPTECERLQGLPDGWTRLDARTPDSRRYSALGDAVTANVAEWLGNRILGKAAWSL